MADSTDNKQSIQLLIDANYALLQAEQALYASLQAQKAALIASSLQPNDLLSQSRGGDEGNEAYTYQSVNQQLVDSAKRLKDLTDELKNLMMLQNQRFPWVVRGVKMVPY